MVYSSIYPKCNRLEHIEHTGRLRRSWLHCRNHCNQHDLTTAAFTIPAYTCLISKKIDFGRSISLKRLWFSRDGPRPNLSIGVLHPICLSARVDSQYVVEKSFTFQQDMTFSLQLMSHHPSHPLLMINIASKQKGCLHSLLKSQSVSLCVQFFNLDHCVVINMHWKVLCFCRSHGSLICCVLMYSIYSGLFSRANLATRQTYISVHWPSWLGSTACLIYWKGKQATVVPRVLLLEWGSQAALISVICECGESLEWDMYFTETVSVLNFCSPLYINLKFSRKVLIFNFFLTTMFLRHGLS